MSIVVAETLLEISLRSVLLQWKMANMVSYISKVWYILLIFIYVKLYARSNAYRC